MVLWQQLQHCSSILYVLASVTRGFAYNQQGAEQFCRAGIIFTVCSEPYLLSEYGAEYMSEAPVKLLERLMHGERLEPDEQVSPTFC